MPPYQVFRLNLSQLDNPNDVFGPFTNTVDVPLALMPVVTFAPTYLTTVTVSLALVPVVTFTPTSLTTANVPLAAIPLTPFVPTAVGAGTTINVALATVPLVPFTPNYTTTVVVPLAIVAVTMVATNRANNPSFETNTTNWLASVGGGPGAVTVTRDTSRFFVGGASGRGDFPAANQDRLVTLANLTGLALTGVTHVAYGRFKVWLAVGVTIPQVLMRWQYTDATVTGIAINNVAGTGDWQEVTIGPWASNPVKTIQSCNFYVGYNVSAPAASWTGWYDAVDIRIDELGVDTYIDGDQGLACAWTGIPHASTSVRYLTLISAVTVPLAIIAVVTFTPTAHGLIPEDNLSATLTIVPLLTATLTIAPILRAQLMITPLLTTAIDVEAMDADMTIVPGITGFVEV